MGSVRIASWNLNAPAASKIPRQMEYLRALDCEVALLQEVKLAHIEQIRRGKHFDWCLSSFDVPDSRPLWPEARHDLGCGIAGRGQIQVVGLASRLPSSAGVLFPAPERSLFVDVRVHQVGILTLASLYQVTGDARSGGWGPRAKRAMFETWAAWLSTRTSRTVVGIDANSPRIDHPDVRRNAYWEDRAFGSQEEHLLHDPGRAPHSLRDIYRTFLDARPDEREAIIRRRPAGPLAVSHVNVSSVRSERRYDFIYATPDVFPVHVEYREAVLERGPDGKRLSDHAPVIGDLELTGGSTT